MPNRYSDAMSVFAKVLKPAFSYLREIGYLSVLYVDDSICKAKHLKNVYKTLRKLSSCYNLLGLLSTQKNLCYNAHKN